MVYLMKTKVKKTKKSNFGFSLIEVLLAVVLLAIVMVPLMQAVLSSMSINAKAKKQMAATDCAQTLIEHFEGMTYDDIRTLLQKPGVNAVSIPFLIEDIDTSPVTTYKGNGASLGTLNLVQGKSTSFSNFNTSIDEKRVYYSEANSYYALSNVKYSDYTFDVDIQLTLAPNNNVGDKYQIYTITVNVFEPDFKSSTPHSRDKKLITLNGSTFNKF